MAKITVSTLIDASLQQVWESWTQPEHITQWCYASEDWESPRATNDLHIGGRFNTRMQAKDGSAGFDFEGTYTEVEELQRIGYGLDDGRHVDIMFEETPVGIEVTETFDPETENSEDRQRQGWQSILDNFKKYVER